MRTMQEGIEHASACWDQKYNCAESVLRGVCHAMEVQLTDQAKKMATPFGGGVGRSEDLCGAITGGVLAIGTVLGRTDATEDRFKSYDAAGKLHRKFLNEFGSTQCRTLNKSDFQSPEHRVRCGGFVADATRIAIEILAERDGR